MIAGAGDGKSPRVEGRESAATPCSRALDPGAGRAAAIPDGSHLGLRFEAASADSGCDGGVIAFVLVGVRLGEVGYCVVEPGRLTEVRGDRNSVARTGVRARERPAAEPGVRIHASRAHFFDLGGEFPVPELP
jgi:hypothetical protein